MSRCAPDHMSVRRRCVFCNPFAAGKTRRLRSPDGETKWSSRPKYLRMPRPGSSFTKSFIDGSLIIWYSETTACENKQCLWLMMTEPHAADGRFTSTGTQKFVLQRFSRTAGVSILILQCRTMIPGKPVMPLQCFNKTAGKPATVPGRCRKTAGVPATMLDCRTASSGLPAMNPGCLNNLSEQSKRTTEKRRTLCIFATDRMTKS